MCATQFRPTLESLESRLLFAHAGDLDTLFSGGKVVADLLGRDDYGFAVVVQNDGKVLVAGQTDSGGTKGYDFAVLRLNADGSRDTTFGTNGLVTTDLGSLSDAAYAMALQSDGKIVVVGTTTKTATSDDFAVVRYSTNGTLDTTFGAGGKVITDFGGNSDQALGVAIDGNGSIVVSGWASVGGLPRFAVARYTSVGQLDTSFGSAGKTTTAFSPGYARGQSVVLLPDGSMVVAGTSYDFSASGGDFAAVKYLNNGQVDTTFGSSGWATVDFGADESAHAILAQPDGKLVLAGEFYDFGSGQADFAVARLTASGALDTSFASGGETLTDFDGDYDQGTSALLQPNGKIVVAGTVTIGGAQEFGVARYNPDGSLDTGFGSSGKATVAFGASDNPNGIALDGQGRILVGGFTMNSAGQVDFAVARFIGKINIAPTANPGSGYTVIAGSSTQLDGSASFDPDGVIVSYEWDLNYNGTTFATDATGATTIFSAAGLTGPMTRTVALCVTDENGATSIATTTVSIAKLIVPPTAVAGSSYTVIAGSSVQLDGSASFDTDGTILNYEWDFNYDGTTFTEDALGATTLFSAAGLTGPATRTVALRVTDNDGATSIATAVVTIDPLPPSPPPPPPGNGAFELDADPTNPGHCDLIVHGTSGNDRIDFRRTGGGQIQAFLNGVSLGTFSNVCRIVADGGDGNDVINAHCANVPVEFFGGAGNDRLYGGRFNDVLVGDDGDDTIWGCGGNDLLIGGAGKDRLFGAQGHDLIISGSLANQDDASSMQSLLKNWSSAGMKKALRASFEAALSIIDDATTPAHVHGNCRK